jgi:hypothetical protein
MKNSDGDEKVFLVLLIRLIREECTQQLLTRIIDQNPFAAMGRAVDQTLTKQS